VRTSRAIPGPWRTASLPVSHMFSARNEQYSDALYNLTSVPAKTDDHVKFRPGSTLEEFRVITIHLQVVQSKERCSMKRKSTICAMQSLLDCETTRILAR
jgi:hypothetical protein